jgi:signal transduction histidine kinase
VSLASQLLIAFGTPALRPAGARRLAARLRADSVVVFTPDLETGEVVPITPFHLEGGAAVEWRRALDIVHGSRESAMTLPHPSTGAWAPVLLRRAEDGSVIAAIGGHPPVARLAWAAQMLPLLAAIARGERASALAARLRQAEARAADASRVKDEFLATLSHELRTPLNAMLGWIQMLRLYRSDERLWQRAIEVIERNARAQTQVVTDLLDLSRAITGKLHMRMSPVDLTRVVQAACEGVRPSVDARNLHLTIEAGSIPGEVYGDEDRLQQVVWNLVSNAAKFTTRGGRIHVELGATDSHAWVQVSDTGVGIHPDFVPHVFDRFRQWDSTLSRAYGGLGLGLAIVRHIVELHGGSVDAASEGEGRGATFTVRLPLRRVQPEAELPLGPSTSDVA